LDTNQIVIPPFPMSEEGVSITIGGKVIEQDRFGFQDPITQWTGGKVRAFALTVKMFSRNVDEDVRAQLKVFEALTIKDETLGRPPIVLFTLGKVINEIVLVESIDPTIKPLRPDGEPREITLSLSMRKYKPFRQRQIDPTKPKKESYKLRVSAALASYEAIALRYYGDPLKGDRLRKRHPENPMLPVVGELVDVPAREIIGAEVVEPAFHALSLTNAEAVAAFEALIEKRSARKVVEIV